MTSNRYSQCERILSFLKAKGSITTKQAISLFSCYRLGARIYDLRMAGVNIKSQRVRNKNGSYHAKYTMEN